PRHRRDALQLPLQGGSDAEPRPFHHRLRRPGRGEGRRDGRGGCPHRAHLPAARRDPAHRAALHRLPLRPLPERLRPGPLTPGAGHSPAAARCRISSAPARRRHPPRRRAVSASAPPPRRPRRPRSARSPSPSAHTPTPPIHPRPLTTRTSTMRNPFESREIWFLTGSQGLYGPETLDQVAEQSRTIASTLDAGSDIPVKIVWKPVLTDRDAIREVALAANAD